MSDDQNSSIKHYVRGGQILFHNLRMFFQVNRNLAKLAFLIWLLVTIVLFGFLTNAQDWLALWGWCQAKLANQFGHPGRLIGVYWQNHWAKETANSILKDPWFIAATGRLFGQGLWAIFSSTSVLLLVGFFGARALKKRGMQQIEDDYLRGMQRVPPKQLSRLVKQSKREASPWRLQGYQLLPFDFERQHILLDGTTGVGKSTLIYKLLKWVRARGDKALVYDKGCNFAPRFYREGVDYLLNPMDARSVDWNVWSDATTMADFKNLAEALIPTAPQADPFWVEAARSILVDTAFKMQQEGDFSTELLLRRLLTIELDELGRYLKDTSSPSLVDEKAAKTAISIKSVLAAYVKTLRFLMDGKSGEPFSIRDWVKKEDDPEAPWLFLTTSAREHATLRPLISMWLTIASLALLEAEESPERRLWFIVDEMPSLHAIPQLPATLAEVRKFGGCWLIGLQSYAQLRKTYGRDQAESIFDLLNTRFFFRAPSYPMAEVTSRELGEQELEMVQEQYGYGANAIRDGVTLSKQLKVKRLVTASEIMTLPDLTCYLRIPGDYPITKLALTYETMPHRLAKGFMPIEGAGSCELTPSPLPPTLLDSVSKAQTEPSDLSESEDASEPETSKPNETALKDNPNVLQDFIVSETDFMG